MTTSVKKFGQGNDIIISPSLTIKQAQIHSIAHLANSLYNKQLYAADHFDQEFVFCFDYYWLFYK